MLNEHGLGFRRRHRHQPSCLGTSAAPQAADTGECPAGTYCTLLPGRLAALACQSSACHCMLCALGFLSRMHLLLQCAVGSSAGLEGADACRHLLEHLGFAEALPKEEAHQATPDVAAAAAALEGAQLAAASPAGADGNAFFDNDGAGCGILGLPVLCLYMRIPP